MVLGMLAILVMLLVFAMGAALMELLFQDAPRRGKRPDILDDSPNCETVLRVTTTDGGTLVGTPMPIVEQLVADGFGPAPRYLTPHIAEKTLAEWERQGMVRIRGEWAEKPKRANSFSAYWKSALKDL